MQDNTNRYNLITILLIVAGLLLLAYTLIPTKKHNPLVLAKLSSMPEPLVLRFDWFDDIDAPIINNRNELSKVWKSKPRCCVSKPELIQNNRELYKACYIAMQNYASDEDINANCLWLMGGALETSEQLTQLYETYIKHFFYYNKKLDHCDNCAPANISARIAQRLARQYKSTGHLNKAIDLLERMNDERSQETSDWVLAELSTQLGEYYLQPEYTGNDFSRIKTNYLKLAPFKNNESLGKRFGKPGRYDKLESIYLKLQIQ